MRSDAIIAVDREGIIHFWNSGARRLFGFPFLLDLWSLQPPGRFANLGTSASASARRSKRAT
jgi:PAS domain-containing protein